MNEETFNVDLVEAVGEVVTRRRLVQEGERVLVAVSGGADSTALLSILHDLSGRLHFELVVGHFDHRLRDTSSVDRKTVEVTAAKLGLAFHYGEGDVHARAEGHGETIEEAARKLRYQYLFELADEVRADRVATGHTRDDQIETVLMRILRGTGTRGLCGIRAQRGRLIRPLLGLAHLQLVTYCRDHHIPFVEDPLNRDKRFTRNWLRFELLPSIRKYYPNVGENLLRLSRNAYDAVQRTQRITGPLIENNLRVEHVGTHAPLRDDRTADADETAGADWVWTLDLAGVTDLDQEAKYILFGDLLTDHLGHDPDYSRHHFEKLGRLSGRSAESGEQLSIPGFTVRREFDTLVFLPRHEREEAELAAAAVELPVPGEATFGAVRFAADVNPAGEAGEAGAVEPFDGGKYRATEPPLLESGGNPQPGVGYFALAGIEPPLTVRAPRAGDRMRPFGMRGSKKLSDIFIDKKIPLRRRDRALVITDQKRILWLVGVATSETTRIASDTENVLKITAYLE
jgi:tRNA(Ile)-lysidine synthase